MVVAGWLRLGTYVRYIPYPVTVGFTAGIGVIIFSSQIRDLPGLTFPGAEPSAILAKLETLWAARDSLSPAALAIALGTVALIVGVKRLTPGRPNAGPTC
jgi:SulP family sulfate permease